MEFTRRKFLRLAPASVGALALGVAVLPESRRPGGYFYRNSISWLGPNDSEYNDLWEQMNETILVAAQKVVDPPHFVVIDGSDPSLPDHYFFPGDTGFEELHQLTNWRARNRGN